VDRLLEGFRSDCQRLQSQIIDALEHRNYESVKDAAHALKGAAGGIGAVQMLQFATSLELATHETLDSRASELIEDLRTLLVRTFRAMDAHLIERHQRMSSN
jgi:HPt (histidine-containing phosphotransfer) domain-containing protein